MSADRFSSPYRADEPVFLRIPRRNAAGEVVGTDEIAFTGADMNRYLANAGPLGFAPGSFEPESVGEDGVPVQRVAGTGDDFAHFDGRSIPDDLRWAAGIPDDHEDDTDA